MQGRPPDAINTNTSVILFAVIYENIFLCTYLLISGIACLYSLSNSVVDTSTVNAFKARLGKYMYRFGVLVAPSAADLAGTENRSEEVTK